MFARDHHPISSQKSPNKPSLNGASEITPQLARYIAGQNDRLQAVQSKGMLHQGSPLSRIPPPVVPRCEGKTRGCDPQERECTLHRAVDRRWHSEAGDLPGVLADLDASGQIGSDEDLFRAKVFSGEPSMRLSAEEVLDGRDLIGSSRSVGWARSRAIPRKCHVLELTDDFVSSFETDFKRSMVGALDRSGEHFFRVFLGSMLYESFSCTCSLRIGSDGQQQPQNSPALRCKNICSEDNITSVSENAT